MPLWFIELAIIFVFAPPLMLGLLALLLIGTYMQVQDEMEEEDGEIEEFHA